MSKLRIIAEVQAKDVAKYAQALIEGDKAGRRRLYKNLGLPPDASAK